MVIQIIYWTFSCFIGIISQVNKNKFFRNIFLFLIISYFVIISGFNLTNLDNTIYYNIFVESKSAFFTKDLGYGLLLAFAHSLNLDYKTFRLFEYLIAFVLIHISLKKLIKNEEVFFLVYFIYPFFLDIIETRNFLAVSLLLFSLPYFLSSKKERKLLFLIIYLFSCLVHKIMFIYIPCFFFVNSTMLSKKKLIVFLFIALSFGFLGLDRQGFSILLSYLSHSLSLLTITGVSRNLSVLLNNGWVVNYAITYCMFFGSLLLISDANTLFLLKKLSKKSLKFCNLAFALSFYSCLFLPFYAISSDFMRVVRNVLPLLIIEICLLGKSHSLINKNSKIVWGFILVFSSQIISIASIFYPNQQVAWIFDSIINNTFFNNTWSDWIYGKIHNIGTGE